ncbi:MAG: redox-regulated ATPase YchF [Anaerolineae bacterium]|jgi:GTP-binding protein YchF
MDIAIVGLPLSGKTTIFNALTGADVETSAYAAHRADVRVGVVDVPDSRVSVLSAMFKPRKTTRAQVRFSDVSGVAAGAGRDTGLDAQVLNAIAKGDAILLVVRGFASDDVPHPQDSVDAARDLQDLRFELQFADLAVASRRAERIEDGLRKARTDEKPALEQELGLMRRIVSGLEAGQPVRDLDLDAEEERLLRGFQFLSAKPEMVVVNLGEDDDLARDLSWANHHRRSLAMLLKGTLEMEIAQLPADEATVFLGEFGLSEPGLHALVRACYDLLGLMSFFTVGEDEVRAWTVRRGATAVEAAGAIHTDLARGFIRAEVLSYDAMIACGTIAEARRQGKLRLEGRDYVVQDGDILNIRFNV